MVFIRFSWLFFGVTAFFLPVSGASLEKYGKRKEFEQEGAVCPFRDERERVTYGCYDASQQTMKRNLLNSMLKGDVSPFQRATFEELALAILISGGYVAGVNDEDEPAVLEHLTDALKVKSLAYTTLTFLKVVGRSLWNLHDNSSQQVMCVPARVNKYQNKYHKAELMQARFDLKCLLMDPLVYPLLFDEKRKRSKFVRIVLRPHEGEVQSPDTVTLYRTLKLLQTVPRLSLKQDSVVCDIVSNAPASGNKDLAFAYARSRCLR